MTRLGGIPFDLGICVRPYRAADYMVLPTNDELLEDAWRLWLDVVDPFRVELVVPPAIVSEEQTR